MTRELSEEFARWVHDTSPSELILRMDVTRLHHGGEFMRGVMIGFFEDSDGWDFGLYHFNLGYGRNFTDKRWPRIRYYTWRRADWHFGLWQERGATATWDRDWKVQKPVQCRYRRGYTGPRSDEEWQILVPSHRLTLQYASQVLGIVRGLHASSTGHIDPYVHRKTEGRLQALIALGNGELERLVA